MRRRRDARRVVAAAGAAVAAALLFAGCGVGGEEGGSGARAINWYVFNEPGGAYEQAAADCTEQSNGRYSINYVRLPTDANQQRELIVRRLAAEDSSIDLVGMDVIWTAEFAEAGWIRPWEGARRSEATEGKLRGPLQTVQYQDKVWGIPFTSNTQLLWFRRDRIERPPQDFTWDQMISQAVQQGTAIEVQARQYEGFAVWVNALIAGAGGQIVDEEGDPRLDPEATRKSAEIIKRLATSPAAAPGMATAAEDDARLGFESGRSNYQINYPFIYPSAAEVEGFQEKIGWTRYPRSVDGRPSRPPLGGINIGVSAYSSSPELAFEAATCLASPENQAIAAEKGGLPPTTEAAYENPRVQKAYPFADLLRTSIEEAAPRPVTPAYSDISLAIQRTYHPPDGIEVGEIVERLRDRLEKAGEGKIF